MPPPVRRPAGGVGRRRRRPVRGSSLSPGRGDPVPLAKGAPIGHAEWVDGRTHRWGGERSRVLRIQLVVTLVVIVSVIVAWATPTLAPLLDITPLPADRATALIRHSTVQILAFGCNLQRHDGSGVAIAPDRVLTNASGFNGADGVFRFRSEGPNDRGLAVLQISNGAASVLSSAPRSFAGG